MSASHVLDDKIALSKSSLKTLYMLGGIAAILQLVAILSYGIVITVLGPKPASAILDVGRLIGGIIVFRTRRKRL